MNIVYVKTKKGKEIQLAKKFVLEASRRGVF